MAVDFNDRPISVALARRFPWATLVVVGLALATHLLPALAELSIYDRRLIVHGEIWRTWTGHIVHFGRSHLFWDVAVFLPAGCWLERLWPRRARWFYLVCPLAISTALFVLEPTLLRYAGLSGLATGTLVLLAALQLQRRSNEPAWFWWSVLALVGLKIGIELFTGAPLMVTDFVGIRSVPLAHIGGAVCGLVFVVFGRAKSVRH